MGRAGYANQKTRPERRESRVPGKKELRRGRVPLIGQTPTRQSVFVKILRHQLGEVLFCEREGRATSLETGQVESLRVRACRCASDPFVDVDVPVT